MTLILVVEDALVTRRKICKILQAEGYEVLEAPNGKEGLRLAIEQSPDCILLDLLMPEMEGQEVLQALQELHISIPTIVVTADIQETSRQQCLALGAIAVINKPPKSEELIATVKKALSLTQENGA